MSYALGFSPESISETKRHHFGAVALATPMIPNPERSSSINAILSEVSSATPPMTEGATKKAL